MAFDQSALAQVFDPVPDDIVAYFDHIDDGSLSSLFEFELNLLPVSRAIGLTAQFRQFHPIVRALNGFVLDDSNTSHHHVYLAAAPLMGAILFLSHDGDSRVVYPSLNDFLRAAETTKKVGRRFSEIHPLHSPVPSNQAALSEFVSRQLDIGGATEAIAAVIPSMDLHDLALLRRLAKDDDFFLGEAVGIEIAKRPSVELREIAELCAAHRHRQVANAGRRACVILDSLN